MSFDATCTCPRCHKVWYECATGDETFNCPNCGYKNIEPEELDLFCLDMDEKERRTCNYRMGQKSYFKKTKRTTYWITELKTQLCWVFFIQNKSAWGFAPQAPSSLRTRNRLEFCNNKCRRIKSCIELNNLKTK